MLTIRLNRTGRKNRPQFRVVLQERAVAPGGRHVEVLGSYDPFLKKAVLKNDRISYWLGKGAQASDTAHNLLVREGIVSAKKRAVKMPKPAVKEEEKSEEASASASATDAETVKEEGK